MVNTRSKVKANYMFEFTSIQIYGLNWPKKETLSFPPADRTLPSRGSSIHLSVSSTWCGKATRNTSSSPWSCSSQCSSWPCCSTHCRELFHRRLSMDETPPGHVDGTRLAIQYGQPECEAPLWLGIAVLQKLWDHTDVSPLL